ncbi:hypothetical protein SAMN05216421_0557 [Halopseudomonas xinjiangensis]|uniref:Uncharacterized protein n=1 Tax=Halopseudomonas xinjiangensis TaxID=487184 RepID=A0A1H1MX63_9GAMM|nr:hypothetical protein [Halopseudomonas xinjiangensis]SDR91222.1 hypothetical protein SAMN05216421_0557 [Halopseudomonas xinjiangensis]
MSAVLHLATLVDREFCTESQEYTALVVHLQRLDELARTLGVTAPSQFIDVTELEFREAAQLIEPDSAVRAEPDPVTGLFYGIEDMSWSPVAIGMVTLEALGGYLSRNQPSGISEADRQRLREELSQLELHLRPLEAEGAQFHLAAR